MTQEHPKFKFLPRLKGNYSFVPPGAPPEIPNPWLNPMFFPLFPIAREIAKSGIITVDEMLKGHINTPPGIRGRGRKYEVDDLPGFVLKLAQALEIFPKLEKKEEWQKILDNRVASLLKEFDDVTEVLRVCNMAQDMKTFGRLRQSVIGAKEKALPRVNPPIIKNVIDLCITTFKNHISEAIDEVIAERIFEVLRHFKVKSIKSASILKRIQRKFN